MATRKEQQAQRRENIMRVAMELFIDKGFYGASTTEIATRCKMSSGLMFHYFPTKEALYLGILEHAAEQMGALSEAVLPNATPLSTFEHMAAFTLEMFQSSPEACKTFVFIKQAMLGGAKVPGVDEALAKMDAIGPLSQLIEAGQASGEIRQGNPLAMSAMFFSSLQGVGEMTYRYPQLPLPEAAWMVAFMKKETQ